jgi:hypothetical protein
VLVSKLRDSTKELSRRATELSQLVGREQSLLDMWTVYYFSVITLSHRYFMIRLGVVKLGRSNIHVVTIDTWPIFLKAE